MTRVSGSARAEVSARLRIRPLRADELDALIELYRHLHASDAPLPERPRLDALWQRILADPALHYPVAELDGRLVASCTIAIIPNLTRGARPYGLIENVVTHAEHRRQGIGLALMQHALQIAWSERCYKVMLLTARGESAHRFYEVAGFVGNDKRGFVARPPA